MRRGAGRPHPGPRPRRGVVEAGRHPQHVAPLPWRSRRRWRRGASARPPRPTGPGAWCSRTSGCSPSRSDRPATATSCGAPVASTAGTWPRAAPPRSSGPSSAASPSPRADTDALGGPGRACAAGGRRRLLRCGAPDRRRPRLRSGAAGHPGRHRAAALRRAEPARHAAGGAPSWETRCARLIAGEVAAAFDRRGHLVLEERSGRLAVPRPGTAG